MTNTAKHTPTPWFTEHNGVQKIYAQGAGDIAHVFANCLMGDCKANAAFIVKAVNCHEKFEDKLSWIANTQFHAETYEGLRKHLNHIQKECAAALAAAEA